MTPILTLISVAIAFIAAVTISTSAQPLEELLRARSNGCGSDELQIVKAPYYPDWCKAGVCVFTHDALLKESALQVGCGPINCTEEGDGSTFTKRTGGTTTSMKGGKGTCALPPMSRNTFYCSPTSKITVTIDGRGVATYQTEGEEGKVPTVIAGSKGPKELGQTSGTTDIPYDQLSIICTGADDTSDC